MQQEPTIENVFAEIRTIVNDRNGNVKEFFYDRGNRCTIHREYTGRANPTEPTTNTANRPTDRLREEKDPEFFETRFEYNNDFLRTRTIHPNGNITENIYEGDLNPQAPARFRGNLRIVRNLPGDHRPIGDQDVIEESFDYDTDFGCGGCGFNFVTRHVDGRGNETLSEYDDNGNLEKRTHRIPSIVEEFEYNEFGQMTKRMLPDNGSSHRRVDVFMYYTKDEDDDQEGYLKQEIIDEPNFALTTTYEYDKVGNVIRRIDPRGHGTQFIYNSLDQVVREISREVSEGSDIRYERDTYYDANNNVIQIDIENINAQNELGANTHFTTTHEYDILNYLIRRTEEVDEENIIVTEYRYDANRNQTEIIYGEATNGNQSTNTITREYDERDLLFLEIRAEDDPLLRSSTQFDYDPNKNLIRRTQGLEAEKDQGAFTPMSSTAITGWLRSWIQWVMLLRTITIPIVIAYP